MRNRKGSELSRIDKETVVLIKAISRSILWIGLTISMCFGISKCSLNDKIIITCQEECQASGRSMASVTSSKCECEGKEDTESFPSVF